jgi:ABC-2 type transport system ATP-binding protein
VTTAISIDHITKQYDGADRAAVKNLSLNIDRAEIYGLLGPNGAGKSTTVMMLCGLLIPDSGSIKVFGRDPVQDGAAVRRTIGVATQDIALFPSLTALENLNYLSHIYGLRPDTKKINTLLDRFGLSLKAHERVSTYSGGMKRRLNLIASLLHSPQLLILDEPTAGVDVQSRIVILDYLRELNADGMTIIYSSHILEEAERLCHRVCIINEGQLLEQGTISDLSQKYNTTSLENIFLTVSGRCITS